MKYQVNLIVVFGFFLITTLAFSQQEASVWYFGENAGIKFDTNGTISTLTDGQLNTSEGCATIADSNGNLLFYTDGVTVWNRNHSVMLNGTGLMGHASTTQSATIVPLPGSTTLYYIFTLDYEVHPNGFRYSIVDLTLDGGLGGVTTTKNVLIYTPTDEKLSIVKHANNIDYWVVTHGWNSNTFYSYLLSAGGLSSVPVTSNAGIIVSGSTENVWGCMKISPDGSKLAISHSLINLELMDFDNNSGIISNPRVIFNEASSYGVEFSPNSQILYITVLGISPYRIIQYNLNSNNIPNSAITFFESSILQGALQLAPNNKIYIAQIGSNKLGVINNPNLLGASSNIQLDSVDLLGRNCQFGLPPFITSFFNASFTVENFCLGSATQFTLNSTTGVTSVSWDFGDGSPLSNVLNPSHNYLTAGNYTVTLTATAANGTSTKTRTITIAAIPVVANTVANQTVCGSDNMSYSLAPFTTTLLGSQSNTLYGVTYFLSSSDATNHVNVLPINYSLPLGVTTFYAKIHSITHISCYVLTSFTITLYLQPVATTPNAIFSCDDSSNDGIGNFDLQSVKATVLGTQNATLYTVSFHLNQNDAGTNSNALALNYQNIANPQTIFIRIENNQQTSCFATTSFQIGLYKKPIAHQPTDLFLCDDGNDGIETFVLTPQTTLVLGTQLATDFSVSYHANSAEANSGANPLGANFSTTSNSHTIYVRIQNNLSPTCFAITSFQLQLKAEPILNIDETYSICEGNSIAVSAPTGFSSYLWSNGDTTPTAHITQAGNYSLTVTKNYGSISCSTSQDFVVYNSNVATITQIITTDWTDNQNSITVVVTGDGNYEYSLDGIEYQDSNTFYGLQNGQYTVYVNDKKECGIRTQEVFLLMYPKFFTPNGDGFHDTWQIKFSIVEPNMQLTLFDRYGKLIKRFTGTDFGWDGTLNGKSLFSDDYWFVVKRGNGKEYIGHFSLKR